MITPKQRSKIVKWMEAEAESFAIKTFSLVVVSAFQYYKPGSLKEHLDHIRELISSIEEGADSSTSGAVWVGIEKFEDNEWYPCMGIRYGLTNFKIKCDLDG